MLSRTAHPLGDVLSVDGDTAGLLSYYRNNVLHLFTASAWIAVCFLNNRRLSPRAGAAPGPHGVPVPAGGAVPAVGRGRLRRTHRPHHRGVHRAKACSSR